MATRRGAFAALCAAAMACSGGGGDGGPITVSGKVVYDTGLPAVGVPVQLGATEVVTAADGSFSFSEVARPFDLHAGAPGQRYSAWFRGLTRANPELHLVAPRAGEATISGTVTGRAAGSSVEVCFCAGGECSPGLVAGSTYTLVADIWGQDGTATGTLLAWERTSDGGFGKWVETDAFEVADGGTVTRDLTLATPVEVTTISGTLTVSGSGVPSLAASARSARGRLFLGIQPATPGPFSLQLPVFPGRTLRISGRERGADSHDMAIHLYEPVAHGTSKVNLAPGEVPYATSPAAPVSADSVLSWSRDAGEVARVDVACTGTGVDVFESAWVAGSSVRLGDVLALLPSAVECEWTVGLVPGGDVDAVAAPGWTFATPNRQRVAEGASFQIP